MSKALRTAMEIPPDVLRDVLGDVRHLAGWSPSRVVLSGQEPPCFREFMSLMECRTSSDGKDCAPKYAKLMKCMRECGL